jgi:hypothetical protein
MKNDKDMEADMPKQPVIDGEVLDHLKLLHLALK